MSKFRFDRHKIDENQLLNVLANEAVNYFKIDVFDEQGFDGKKWKERKKPDASRKILVKTGHLRQSIRIMEKGRNYRKVGTDIPYAQYHNEGTKNIPQRRIIGKSKKLELRLNKHVNKAVKTAFRKVA